jgi:mannose-6-phosphate isomerase-like protein (cupin superfamily)
MAHAVVKKADQRFVADPDEDGLEVAILVDAGSPSVHMELALCRLAPFAETRPLIHAFEESWYVLDGHGIASVADLSYDVKADTFGLTNVAVPERKVAGPEGLTWLRMRAPMPHPLDPRKGNVPATGWMPSATISTPDETNPRLQFAGQFTEADMGPRGPLSMPGYHGPNIKSIFIRMLVDDLMGATQHTQFIVEFGPRDPERQFASPHWHPFEEAYFLLTGSTHGILDGEEYDIEAGDLVWTGVGGTHGFYTTSDVPCRWIEVQTPTPPKENAFYFPKDWDRL